MKKFLLAGVVVLSASTAAMAAEVAPAAYDWTGFYLGLNAGVAWNNSSVDSDVSGILPPGIEDQIDSNQAVFSGGAEMGYNWQIESIVLGLEADFNYLGFDESSNSSLLGATSSLDIKADWFGTLRARLGVAADNLLFYGTGGLAYGNVDAEGKVVSGLNTYQGSESNVSWGWTVGAGMEYAIDQNWIIGAEYLYVDLGHGDFDLNGPVGATAGANVDWAFSVARATVKYKF